MGKGYKVNTWLSTPTDYLLHSDYLWGWGKVLAWLEFFIESPLFGQFCIITLDREAWYFKI